MFLYKLNQETVKVGLIVLWKSIFALKKIMQYGIFVNQSVHLFETVFMLRLILYNPCSV